MAAPREHDAVIFDLGGVVFDSPLNAISDYEKELDLKRNAINHAILAAGHDVRVQLVVPVAIVLRACGPRSMVVETFIAAA